jgi:hypothetical protein
MRLEPLMPGGMGGGKGGGGLLSGWQPFFTVGGVEAGLLLSRQCPASERALD